jgi:tripartite motif-containing protein 71
MTGRFGRGGRLASGVALTLVAAASLWLACARPSGGAVVPAARDATPSSAGTWSVVLTEASLPGHFSDPVAVAIDRAGNVYVADSGNGRIQVLDPSGMPLRQIGKSGGGPGELKRPSGVAVDDAGNVYVADTGNFRVQKFGPDGASLATWGTKGTGEGMFRAPYGVAVDGGGNVYVTDPLSQAVQRVSAADATMRLWLKSEPYGPSIQPFGVAVGPGDTVYLANAYIDDACLAASVESSSGYVGRYCEARHGWVGVFAPDGRALESHVTGMPDGRSGADFLDVRAVAVDAAGHVFVGDRGRNCLHKLDRDGVPLAWAAKASVTCPVPSSASILPGQAPLPAALGSHVRVVGMAVGPDGAIYVADAKGERIVKIGPAGDAILAWNIASSALSLDAAAPPVSPRPPDLAFSVTTIAADAEEHVYAAVHGGKLMGARVRKFAPDGRPIPSWGLELDENDHRTEVRRLLVDRDGHVYTANGFVASHVGASSTITRYSPYGDIRGRWGTSAPGGHRIVPPDGLAVDGRGQMYVVSRLVPDDRLHKVLPTGDIVGSWDLRAILARTSGAGAAPSPLGFAAVTVDPRGHVYVLDGSGDLVVKLRDDGSFVAAWKIGPDRTYWRWPSHGIAADRDGNVYVANRADSRVLKLSPDGALLAEWGSGSEVGQFSDPGDVTVDPRGNVYVVDAGNARVQKLTIGGRGAGR